MRAHTPNENICIDLYLKHARHMAQGIKKFEKQHGEHYENIATHSR